MVKNTLYMLCMYYIYTPIYNHIHVSEDLNLMLSKLLMIFEEYKL